MLSYYENKSRGEFQINFCVDNSLRLDSPTPRFAAAPS